MKSALRAAALLGAFLLIPILPFLWLGESFESSLLQVIRQPTSTPSLCAWIIGLLSADIFLPVPSSAVITYAGGMLGWKWATVVSFGGLSLGSIAGFALARLLGQPILRRFSDEAVHSRLGQWIQAHGVAALILTRALPILSEACVLILGSTRMSWARFLPPLLGCNALLALSYSACGAFFSGDHGFLVAVIASGALPLFIALGIRRRFQRAEDPPAG